jgi:hypothetical protein
VAFADRIVLNKLDLVSPEELAAVKEEISSINHTAVLLETKRRFVVSRCLISLGLGTSLYIMLLVLTLVVLLLLLLFRCRRLCRTALCASF